MLDKYTKVVYQSEPIGKEKIILYLTTFDLEAFKENEELEKIPTQEKKIAFNCNYYDLLNSTNLAEQMSNLLAKEFKDTYEKQLEEMKTYIEFLRKTKIVPIEYSKGSDK